MFIVVQLQVGWSVEGLQRMERHGRVHLPALFHMQLEHYQSAGADCLQQVLFLQYSKTSQKRGFLTRPRKCVMSSMHKQQGSHDSPRQAKPHSNDCVLALVLCSSW